MKRKKNQRAKIKSKNNLGMLDPTLIFFSIVLTLRSLKKEK